MGDEKLNTGKIHLNPCACKPPKGFFPQMCKQTNLQHEGIPENYYIECRHCKKLSPMCGGPIMAINTWNEDNPVASTVPQGAKALSVEEAKERWSKTDA